jgi:glycosyltransferase involved in cell wall biosynthesis
MFNSEDTISDCLESIVKIDYRPLEVIVVNDGSIDKSVEVTQEFIEKNEREGIDFTVLGDEINRGISSAKNRGMKHMKGTYFFFAGSDDIQFPQRVSEPLSYLEENPEVDVVYSDCELWHEAKGDNHFCKRGFPHGMTNENSFLFQLKRSYLWSGALFARRCVQLEFDEGLSSAVDYDWYFNQYFAGRLIHFIDFSLVRYRLHKKNTSKNLQKSTENVLTILQKYDFPKAYDELCKTSNSDELQLSFAWYYLMLKQFDKAFEKLFLVETENFERNFLEATIHASKSDFARAADRFRSICLINSDPPEALNNLAVCLIHSTNEIAEAKDLLIKATKINSNYLDAKNNLLLLSTDYSGSKKLTLTVKPLRTGLTHIDNYK